MSVIKPLVSAELVMSGGSVFGVQADEVSSARLASCRLPHSHTTPGLLPPRRFSRASPEVQRCGRLWLAKQSPNSLGHALKPLTLDLLCLSPR